MDEQANTTPDGMTAEDRPTGPARPDDPFPQPVQEIVDPNDEDALEDRERTAISGAREPRTEDE